VREGLEGEPGTPERGQQPHQLGAPNRSPATECPPATEGVTRRAKVERSKAVATATACASKKRPMA
jgi:hypothetical protein